MSHQYQAIGWNRQKRVYDTAVFIGVVAYIALFIALGVVLFPYATAETLIIRAAGSAAPEARSSLRDQAAALFAQYSVKLSVIIIDIAVQGGTAHDYGWHEFTLKPKDGGEPIRKRQRYFELWSKDPSGSWKISLHINNQDIREELGGSLSHWFLSEEHAASLN